MDTNKMRDTYEAWAIQDAASVGRDLVIDREGDWYIGKDAQFLNLGWASWQAARLAVVVEPDWPDHYDYTNSDVAGAAVLDCRSAFQKAMRAQGLKVAP